MFSRTFKVGYFTLEGLNSFGTVWYFYYFYFYMQKQFGFGNKANLLLAALGGGIYALGSWKAGQIAHRIGYLNALKLGFAIMGGALLVGSQLATPAGQAAVMLTATVGMCFTWPVLEALVSEGESRAGLQYMVGIYNSVWAGTGAVAYFIGGAALDRLGFASLFYVPLAILALQLALTFWLAKAARGRPGAGGVTAPTPVAPEDHPHSPAQTQRFLRMAWVANPFAYIAINTVIAVMPGVASRLGLSTTMAGFLCSTWFFARLGAFVLLWQWGGWHYRFRWLVAAYGLLVASFALILMAPGVTTLVLAQLLFGGAIGLIYYSSLYYSMDLSEVKSEHGGIHEAAIGLGNLAGPAVGAATLHFVPQFPNSGALAVTVLLLLGLGGVLRIWAQRSPPQTAPENSLPSPH